MNLPQQQRVMTAIVGSYPKPPEVYPLTGRELLDSVGFSFDARRGELGHAPFDQLVDEAALSAISDQDEAGIDLVTDGEERRGHYVLSVVNRLGGIDSQHLELRSIRDGTAQREVPRVIGKIEYQGPLVLNEFMFTQAHTSGIPKVGLPGPMTVVDCLADEYYKGDKEGLANDYAGAIRNEVEALVNAGCTVVQFDDPVILRHPDEAEKWGFKALERCFEGFESQATFIVHICRGYPDKALEQRGVRYKAEQDYYADVLARLSRSTLDIVSIEGAQGELELSTLREVGEKTIMLGVLDVGDENVESVATLVSRGEEALQYLPRHQLVLAPDCGMVELTRGAAKAKLLNLSQAARELSQS